MRKKIILSVGIILVLVITTVISASANNKKSAGWLRGSEEEKFHQIEKQFRGFDVAMMEVGHRFRELYFAGQDRNWDYADYQLEKIEKTIDLATERRPMRAESAQVFLKDDLPDVVRLVKERSPASFDGAMRRLQTSCMKCHVAEKVPFFVVQFPKNNLSPIKIHNEET